MNDTVAIADQSQAFEMVICRHGFTAYMRDYDIVAAQYEGTRLVGQRLYRFVGCVSASVETRVDASEYANLSAVDVRQVSSGSDGFDWSVGSSTAHSGISLVEDDDLRRWEARLGRTLHKAVLATEAYRLELVFVALATEMGNGAPPHDR
ncbi:hypothetical protein AB4059_03700 [Lysobacter sp. 2RAF19]